MRKDVGYKRTMANADLFGEASKLVKYLYYRQVPKAVRKHGLFGKLTGMVYRWLQEGKSREKAKEGLIAYCQSLSTAIEEGSTTSTQSTPLTKQLRTSINEQPKVVQPPTTPVQQPIEQRSTNNGQRPTRTDQRYKQARYLSRWNVKRNGRLQAPSHTAFALVRPSFKESKSHRAIPSVSG
jgi:hypothetical protein